MSVTPEDGQGPAAHDALEGVPPPRASTRLVGHDGAIAELMAIARKGHHALILEGEHGIGKATAAFHLAGALLSGEPLDGDVLPEPRPETPAWRQIVQGAHPNLMHLTRPANDRGGGFRTVITVDEVRRVGRFLAMTASVDAPRIVIVDPVGDMQRSAANALLKMLEEPPENTRFLLIAHGASGVLPTIRSRCQRVRFAPLGGDDVLAVIAHVAPGTVAAGERPALAELSGGSPRRAIVMALYGGNELHANLKQLLDAPAFDTPLAHRLADVAGTRGQDMHNALLREFIELQLQQRARQAARSGQDDRARRIAGFQAELAERHRMAEGFGLDRRQEFLISAARTHALLHGPGAS
ncbi:MULTISPECIES: DNA polymerase III subunit delta' [unclassified Roseitalea]|uniref:DNA polymerase III subunit delta' n=1 Tax=unclassified Roseitalea TaxID=2639107 RepID=UPI00273FE3CA|nr:MULTISPECIES: DNA polymerase III subunit delta' [unclassified Roseitalea]